MPRKPLVLFVLLVSFLPAAAHALHFTPSSPIGQLAYPQVTAVAVSESEPRVVYAAAGATLFRSSDAGGTWTTLAVPSASIDHLAVDPTDSAIVYMTGRRRTYRSDDSGVTWKDLTAGLGSVSVRALRIDPQEPSNVYVGAACETGPGPLRGGGVFKSTDRGETWSLPSFSWTCISFLSLDPATPRRLFAETWAGRYRTDDAGRTWRQVSGELPVFDVVADPLDPSRRYGLGHGVPGDGHLQFLASTDGGASWSRQPGQGLPAGGQQLIIDRATGRLFLLGQSFGLYVSDDLGLHWRHIDAVPAVTATPVMMAAAGDVLYVATSRGLYRMPMSDPDSPAVIHLGEAAPLRPGVHRIAVDPTDAATVYATAYEGHGILNAYRVFRSTDSGRTWERITAEDDTAWRFMIAVDAIGDLYGADRGTMWRFAKATQTWETWSAPIGELTFFLANPQRPGWLYAGNIGGSGYSIDGGRTWSRIESVPGGFWSLAIAPNGSDLVGGNNEGAFASSDGGVTWRALPTGRFMTKSVAIAPSRPSTIYRLTNPANGMLSLGLYRSDDGGETWSALRWPGERDSFAPPIVVDPLDHRSLWIGLAHSTDGGVTWTIESSNPPGPIISAAFNANGSVYYVVGRDFQVWKATVRGPRRRAVGR